MTKTTKTTKTPAAPKKEYVDSHLDISGFGTNSDNPKAPLANLKMYVTIEGLKAQLAELESAGVEEGLMDMVMFGGEFTNKSGEEGQWFRVVRSRSQEKKNLKTF